MKRILAVVLLLLSFASAAFAEGSGMPPPKASNSPNLGTVRLAEGPDIPPATARTLVRPPIGGMAA